MRVLGIETSCDETAVAVYDGGARPARARGLQPGRPARGLWRGGARAGLPRPSAQVVAPARGKCSPRPAAPQRHRRGRLHQRARASSAPCWSGPRWPAAWPMPGGCPAIGVHHLEGHLLAPLLEADPPPFPFVALLVSGGHTLLARVEGVGRYEILGSSLDDAAGEAFDKTAKLLGLGYPGGPQLAALAERGRPDVFRFPRPAHRAAGPRFQLQRPQDRGGRGAARPRPRRPGARRRRAAFEEAVVDTLVIKCRRALEADRRAHAGGGRRRRRQPPPARPHAARWASAKACASSTRASSSAPTTPR